MSEDTNALPPGVLQKSDSGVSVLQTIASAAVIYSFQSCHRRSCLIMVDLHGTPVTPASTQYESDTTQDTGRSKAE
jgi:hypothetical protein